MNPLLPSIDVRFNADWANSDSLALIEKFILIFIDNILLETYKNN